MNNKQIICDGCGFYWDEFFIQKHKSGKNFCGGCILKGIKIPKDSKPISQEEFNEMLKVALSTPPLRLEDLKKQLKKERAKKQKRSSKGKKSSK